MNLGTPVLDLSSVLAALTSFGGVTGALTVLRRLFLDHLLSGLDADQQNIILRAVNVVLNFVAILALSLFLFHMPFNGDLLSSTLVVVIGLAAPASHYVYASAKSLAVARAQTLPDDGSTPTQYPVYPAPETVISDPMATDAPVAPATA